jgi:hypothetical protein
MRTISLASVLLAFALSASSENSGINVIVLKPDGRPLQGVLVVVRDYQEISHGNVSDSLGGSHRSWRRCCICHPERVL